MSQGPLPEREHTHTHTASASRCSVGSNAVADSILPLPQSRRFRIAGLSVPSAETAVAESIKTTMLPVCASMKHSRGTWKPVTTSKDLLFFKGGFLTTDAVVPIIRFTTGTETHEFVELDKNAQWFLKGVGGPGTGKGDLKAVEVMNTIRHRFNIHQTESAVADEEPATEAADADDPMNALDDVLKPSAKGKPKMQS